MTIQSPPVLTTHLSIFKQEAVQGSFQYLKWQETQCLMRWHYFKAREEKALPLVSDQKKNKKVLQEMEQRVRWWVCRLAVISSLCLNFPMCNMRIITVPTPHSAAVGTRLIDLYNPLRIVPGTAWCCVSTRYYYCCRGGCCCPELQRSSKLCSIISPRPTLSHIGHLTARTSQFCHLLIRPAH